VEFEIGAAILKKKICKQTQHSLNLTLTARYNSKCVVLETATRCLSALIAATLEAKSISFLIHRRKFEVFIYLFIYLLRGLNLFMSFY